MRKNVVWILFVGIICSFGFSCKSIGIDSSNLSSADAIIGSSVALFEDASLVSKLQEGSIVCEYSEIGHSPIVLNMYEDPENRDSRSHLLYIQEKNDFSAVKKIYDKFRKNVGQNFEFGLYYVKGASSRNNATGDNQEVLDEQTGGEIESFQVEDSFEDPESDKPRTQVGQVRIINNGGDLSCTVVKLCSLEFQKVCSIKINKLGGVEEISVN